MEPKNIQVWLQICVRTWEFSKAEEILIRTENKSIVTPFTTVAVAQVSTCGVQL